MRQSQEEQMKSAMMGLAVGAAMGAVGTYMAQQHPKEIKRAVKKVTHSAEKKMHDLEKMMHNKSF